MFAQDNIKWAKSVRELGNDYNTQMSDDIDLVIKRLILIE